MRMPGVNGTASINVPLNNPPNCPQAPCFFTDINSTVFPAYTFVGAASGWSDADGDVLTYEFGQVSSQLERHRASASMFELGVKRHYVPMLDIQYRSYKLFVKALLSLQQR
eukprot:GHUV01051443.1.p2 GENE.GHUV01051443.1~~GHUV01051443.1.p2  ORF type:complete len:111 (-),score=32.06 GHUV01051443.1:39-371(-)